MNPSFRLAALAVAGFLSVGPAQAGASKWQETDGGRLRIVTEPVQPGSTSLRGALQIDLVPGWKTYWREPGSAGVPPQITAMSGAHDEVRIDFPVPHWVDDPYGAWAGYTEPVTLPLTFGIDPDSPPAVIEANVFLGICKDVCIPFTAKVDIEISGGQSERLQGLLVSAAHGALAPDSSDALSVRNVRWTETGALEIRVSTDDANSKEMALFVSGGTERPFQKPVQTATGVEATFAVQPLFDTEEAGAFDLVIAARHGADTVETTISLPAPDR
ncbi:protein-disulfide reductase DsbD domain-containing protein [Oricola cellulosilytica]|nr:protein-disulfide reductase DsbD domain-containing protein [Oricola cellulosilytica]